MIRLQFDLPLRRQLTVFALLLFLALSAVAQTPPALRGIVVDEQAAVIAGAKLTLKASDGTRKTVVSDANGEFTVPQLAAGRNALTVEFDGFQPFQNPALRLPLENVHFVHPTLFTMSQGDPLVRYRHYEASWFVQDDWRVNQKLTMSYGLRHEFQAQLSDKINFAPRFGIAWSPFKNRRTVIRGGIGIFYDRLTARIYGKAKMMAVDDPGRACQKEVALPDITATYCLPLTA